ncbi:MAG: hypothetical protein WAM65_00915, partial [Candidatus Korobacteraceae bacterium]
AGQKGTGRIEVSVAPDKITVNDGSVPEANAGNNVYKVPPPREETIPPPPEDDKNKNKEN